MGLTYALRPAPLYRPFSLQDGVHVTEKRYDATEQYLIDASGLIESTETISSYTWDSHGPTIVSESEANQVFTILISGSGTMDLKITLDSGRIIEESFAFRAMDGPREGDYSL